MVLRYKISLLLPILTTNERTACDDLAGESEGWLALHFAPSL
jgi:hypothetical protein